ncbi:hypothetical protein HF086_016107 [Spodoptera exigua]|uniref:AMP-binding enzyme C-terminal domain-containing protein n=1 Tax=Spodoptera exigua TaxID=7107 RepID=A0A922SB40_SPOEX|nr:hypothetical protein HF086_016107 [Spodoptera exigua]
MIKNKFYQYGNQNGRVPAYPNLGKEVYDNMVTNKDIVALHKPVFDEVGSVEHYILYGDQAQDGAILFKDFLTETVPLEDFEPVPVNGLEDTAIILYTSGTTGLPKDVDVLFSFLKVVDLETRQPLGPNLQGEICIKGPSVMKAYLGNVQPDCKDEEGFLKTGDVGYYDEDGYFFVVNRIKELIKYNDTSHPAVREVGVVGKPHHVHGEVPVAFIVLQSGATASEAELVEHLNSRVRNLCAGGVRFIDRLPRGAGDKLDRRDLMQRLVEEDSN